MSIIEKVALILILGVFIPGFMCIAIVRAVNRRRASVRCQWQNECAKLAKENGWTLDDYRLPPEPD